MEIKILCGCGSKFKFDVEPRNGQMPCRVNCPTCGIDATTAANEVIQQRLQAEARAVGPTSVVSSPPPEIAPPPSPSPSSASAPSAPRGSPSVTVPPALAAPNLGRRVNPPAAPVPAPAAAPPVNVGTPAVPSPPARRVPAAEQNSGRGREVRFSWKTKLGIGLALLLAVGALGWKWYPRVKGVAPLAQTMGEARVEKKEPEVEQRVWADDSVRLIIKHTNETDIARACVDFWQDRLKKKLTVVSTNEHFPEANQIAVLPVHRGLVQIIGGLSWPKPHCEDLAQFVSERFNTLALVTRDVDFSGAYLFAVFEHGMKKFRAEMELEGKTLADQKEVVKTEGEAWAITYGYKPGKEGFKEFHLGEADKIAKRLGINLGAAQEDKKYLLLVESVGPLAMPGLKRPIRRSP